MTSESIPGNIVDLSWSLATIVCRESKIDSDQWQEILPVLKGVLIERWRHECQNVTDLEEQEWTDLIRREYRALAVEKCEPAWRRFLYYKRCKHLRYIAILVSSVTVSYLCPQQTVYLLLGRSQQLWALWYFTSTFVTLICVPLTLTLAVSGQKVFTRQFAQRMTAAVLTLGFVTPLVLLFATLFWQWSGNVHEWSSWTKSLLAIPFCLFGSVTLVAEVFQWTAKRLSHPLKVCLKEKLNPTSTSAVREKIEQQLTQFALEVCCSSSMDDDSFQHQTAEDIYNSLYILWEDRAREDADPQKALMDTLKDFGPIENAVYKDDLTIRLLFYHRHRATRYLVMIGVGLFFVYLLLMVTTGADLNERWVWSAQSYNVSFIRNSRTNGIWLWALWDDNVLSSSLLATCIFLKSRLSSKFSPFHHLFALGALWWLGMIVLDAVFAWKSIFIRWNGWEHVLPMGIFGLVVCPALTHLMTCAVCEYFAPFSDKTVAKMRRWNGRFNEFSLFSDMRVSKEKKL